MADQDDVLPFFSIPVRDVLADFADADDAERGAAWSLMFGLWAEGGSLPFDPRRLARRAGTDPTRWEAMWVAIGRFFVVDGDRLTHPTVTAELARARKQRAARSKAAEETNAKRNARRSAERTAERPAERSDSDAPSGAESGTPPSPSPFPSGSGSSTPDVGGGAAASSFEVSEADLREAVRAWKNARPRVAGAGPEPEERDLRAFRAALSKYSPDRRALIARVAAAFYAAGGKDRRDTWWRDGNWSLHMFVTQGLPRLMGEVEAAERSRKEREERDRLEAERDRQSAAAIAEQQATFARYPRVQAMGPRLFFSRVAQLGLDAEPLEAQCREVQRSLEAEAARGAA